MKRKGLASLPIHATFQSTGPDPSTDRYQTMKVLKTTAAEAPIVPLLIGKGKLARHLHHYFHLIEYPHKHYDDARNLIEPDLYRKISEVNAIWILTSDQSIDSVFQALKIEMIKRDLDPEKYTFIHSSAATEIRDMHTLHPLMTFGPELYTLEQYQKIPFAVISSDAETLSENFTLTNPRFQIFSAQRALYHAYAVMMSNLPILLWSLTTAEAKQRIALSPDTFHPILKQTVENFIHSSNAALTGPIARNDTATIEKNLKALGKSPLTEIYQSFLTALKEKPDDHST